MSPEKKQLGLTGIAIAPVILGCGNFGGVGSPRKFLGQGLDPEASHAAMDEAVALGIDVFDTANSYADGASERLIGEWLASQAIEVRGGVRISTKVGNVVEDDAVRVDLSAERIAAQLEQSLERLGREKLDLCLCHAPDPGTPIETTLEGFAAAIDKGWIGHIGASNFSASQLEEALAASERLGLPRFEWVQNEYNLLHRSDEKDVFPICEGRRLGVTPFSPVAGGALSGKYVRGEPPPPGSRLALRPEGHTLTRERFEAIDRLRSAGADYGVSAGAMALAWVLGHPLVTAAVVGPSRTAEHLSIAREAMTLTLDPERRPGIGLWFTAVADSPAGS